MHVDSSERDPIFAELDRLIKMMPPDDPAAEEEEIAAEESLTKGQITIAWRNSGANISLSSVYGRIRLGWSLEDAIHKPLQRPFRKRSSSASGYGTRQPGQSYIADTNIMEAVRNAGVSIEPRAVYQRLSRGWELHDAIHKPLKSNGKAKRQSV